MIQRFILFLVFNFGALAIGGIFTGQGVSSAWYNTLLKAPWTPPGWVFGVAWTIIMICLSFYLANSWKKVENIKLFTALYIIQWILNVSWNPVFFYFHFTTMGLVLIILLNLLVGYFIFGYYRQLNKTVFWVLPYFVWLIIATSLNAYVVLMNPS